MSTIEPISPEVQVEIEKYSALLYSAEEICIILKIPEDHLDTLLIRNDFYLPYKRGRLITEASVRKAVINQALDGSSAAQLAALKLIDDINLKDPLH